MARRRLKPLPIEKGYALSNGIVQQVSRVDAKIPPEQRQREFKLLEERVLYNGLYSSLRTMSKSPNGGIAPVPEFPVAKVEIYEDRRRLEKIYVVLPYEKVISNIDNASYTFEQNYLKPILLTDVGSMFANPKEATMYSDKKRAELFRTLVDRAFFHVQNGDIPNPPPHWFGVHLYRAIDDILRYVFGFQEIEFLFLDEDIEDIFVNGLNQYVRAKSREYNDVITSIMASKNTVERFTHHASLLAPNVKFNEKHPVIDTQIEGYFNIRVNLTYGGSEGSKGFSVDGITMTLRKAIEVPPSIALLLQDKYRSINEEVGAILFELIHRRISMLLFGETGSGKTTLLKSLMTLAPPSARRVSLEDTVEFPPLSKWGYHHVRLHAKSPLSKISEDEWDMEKGSKNLLRMRPEIAILGEVRYKEARTLFEMAQMGTASVYSTAHGKGSKEILQRLVQSMGVDPSSITSIDAILLLRTLRPFGYPGFIRRVTEVSFLEEKGWDEKVAELTLSTGEETKTFLVKKLIDYRYKYDPKAKRLDEKWLIDWDLFFNSRIAHNIVKLTGITYPMLAEELVEKYNFLRAIKQGFIKDDYEEEFNRVKKWVIVYYIVKGWGYNGKEFWPKFVRELEYQYGIKVRHKWEDWKLKELLEIAKATEEKFSSF